MAITLITTAGAVDANAFVSLADANTYHKGRVQNPEWTSASSGDKSAAIVMATRTLCHHYQYRGTKTNETGSLDWPRTGVTDENAFTVDPDTVPQFMEDATSEFAFLLLREDSTTVTNVSGALKELEAGDVSLAWNWAETQIPSDVPKAVERIIAYYVPTLATAMVVRLIRA